MECTCVRQTDLPNTSKLFADLIYGFDRVSDLYPGPPNDIRSIVEAARFEFPAKRRAELVRALTRLNAGNPALDELGLPDTVAIVTGQQAGLFSGPAYTVYKALTAIRIASELKFRGVNAVPVFWLATEDHDLAEVDHAWVFGADHRPVKLQLANRGPNGSRPVGTVPLSDPPLAELKAALDGLPFADEAFALAERTYRPDQTLGSAFAALIRELFAPYGLLVVDPLEPAIRKIAAPLMAEAVERMPELNAALIERGGELAARGYHAQVLVDDKTSLAFVLKDGHRLSLRGRKYSAHDLAAEGENLSPNALLRPVIQDFLFPTAAYVGGPAELAYLAQSQVLYQKLLGRQPIAFPRAGFTLLDARSAKRMAKYDLRAADLFSGGRALSDTIAARLVPPALSRGLDKTKSAIADALDAMERDLREFDFTLAGALATSRRKIEYQAAKMTRKTQSEIFRRDEQARLDASSLNGLVFPEDHLQERLYSIVPLIAKFGLGLIGDVYGHVRVECPDHQLAVVT